MRPPGVEPPVLLVPAPGLKVEPEARVLVTVVGSCVAVCVFDLNLGLGGMAHFLLPHRGVDGKGDPLRYGDEAVPLLIRRMLALGAPKARLIARMAGGGRPPWLARGFADVGDENVRVAREMLRAERIALLEEIVGGETGRALRFRTDTGSLAAEVVRTPRSLAGPGPTSSP